MTEGTRIFPALKYAREGTHKRIGDHQKWTFSSNEEEFFHQIYDLDGENHVCQLPFNRWWRCRKANPASFDVSLVCQKFHEDYVECSWAFKQRARSKEAKRIWAEFEKRKANGTLPEIKKKYTPLYCL